MTQQDDIWRARTNAASRVIVDLCEEICRAGGVDSEGINSGGARFLDSDKARKALTWAQTLWLSLALRNDDPTLALRNDDPTNLEFVSRIFRLTAREAGQAGSSIDLAYYQDRVEAILFPETYDPTQAPGL